MNFTGVPVNLTQYCLGRETKGKVHIAARTQWLGLRSPVLVFNHGRDTGTCGQSDHLRKTYGLTGHTEAAVTEIKLTGITSQQLTGSC